MLYDKIAENYDHCRRDQLSYACVEVVRSELEARGLRSPQRILDVACGTGLISKCLHQLGHHVTGIDASDAMLSIARRRLPKGGVRFELADLTLYRPSQAFPVVLCFGDVINHFSEPEEARQVIRKLFRFLAPGGSLIADTNTLETYRSELWNCEKTGDDDEPSWEARAYFEPERELAHLEIAVGTLHRARLVERFYSDEQLWAWFQQAGFAQIRCRGFNPIPELSDIACQKTLWLAQKPES